MSTAPTTPASITLDSAANPTGATPATGGKPYKAAISNRAREERKLGWMLAGPAFIVMVLVTFWPILNAVYLSLFNYRLTDPNGRKFVWFNNYVTALSDPLFWKSLGITAAITIITLFFELILGFVIALLMNKVIIPRRTLRTVVLIPYAIVTVVSAFSWKYAAGFDTGFINHWLHTLTFGSFSLDYNWFGGTWSSLVIICLSEIWKTTPFMSLLLLAGLAQIDGAMEEAAQVDGATWWQKMSRVVLPNMKSAIMVATLFRTLDAFRIYDNPFIMTGGANNTMTLSMLVANETISRVEIGMGSCLAVILFLCVLAIAALFVKGFNVDLAGGRN